MVSKYNTGFRSLLQQGLSEPEFDGDLVYKFRKIVGKTEFSDKFKKIIMRYKRIGYNVDVMRQSACLLVNPIMVNNNAVLFNCMPVGRGSDSMIAPITVNNNAVLFNCTTVGRGSDSMIAPT